MFKLRQKKTNPSLNNATLFTFVIETAVYGAFVFAYYFLVLHFLGGWLKNLFDRDKLLYAFVALGLMIVQGAGLEMLTTGIFRMIRGKAK